MAKETYAYYATLLARQADRFFLQESRGSQDILNLAKVRGGEWNDMISGQATDRSPDAPDAHYLARGLADFMCLARFTKNGSGRSLAHNLVQQALER